MRSPSILAGLFLSFLAAVPAAQAGGGDRYDDDAQVEDSDRSFRCDSDNQRTVYCHVEPGQDVRFVRQHSRAACIEGQTWGWDRGGVWVSGGCRAEFETSEREVAWGNRWNSQRDDARYDGSWNRDGLVRCESSGSRTVYCRADTWRGVRLANQLSHAQCIEGQSWGHDERGIWVNQGCRAEFLLTGNDRGNHGGGQGGSRGTVTCESEDGRYVFCRSNRVRDVQLQRQLSRGACVQGQSWGYRSDGIWVSNGCRAEFTVY